jgi:hypothetical protein
MAMSAGQRLRRSLDSELRKAAKTQGVILVWSPAEVAAIATAVRAADYAEVLQARFDSAAAADAEDAAAASVLVKVSAELRLLHRLVADMVARLQFGPGKAKSERHVRSARTRWDRAAEVLS